jgi:hypothetical protein
MTEISVGMSAPRRVSQSGWKDQYGGVRHL